MRRSLFALLLALPLQLAAQDAVFRGRNPSPFYDPSAFPEAPPVPALPTYAEAQSAFRAATRPTFAWDEAHISLDLMSDEWMSFVGTPVRMRYTLCGVDQFLCENTRVPLQRTPLVTSSPMLQIADFATARTARFEFDHPVTAFGSLVWGSPLRSMSATFSLGEEDVFTLTATQAYDDPSGGSGHEEPWYFGVVSASQPFDRVRFHPGWAYDTVLYGDITISATPEPATLGLLAAGLLPIAALARRRRTRTA